MRSIDEICSIYSERRSEQYDEAADHLISLSRSGLTAADCARLAQAIAVSGRITSLPKEIGPFADVPSTGAPGSLTTVLCPVLVASTGVSVPKISATGSIAGSIDVFQAISGFVATLDEGELVRVLRECRFAHTMQTDDICPADRALIKARRKRGAMRNRYLAAISLLGKKLAVPGTSAAFDLRMGATGNLGDNIEEMSAAASEFLSVARISGVNCAVFITDNRTMPCSALGRLESLQLMANVLRRNDALTHQDALHVETCITLATSAVNLAQGKRDAERTREGIRRAIDSGTAWNLLGRHLDCQGASLAGLEKAIAVRNSLTVTTMPAPQSGYWREPDLDWLKNWFKQRQAEIDPEETRHPELQFGLKFLAMSGEQVQSGQTVIEMRAPAGFSVSKTEADALSGSVWHNQPARNLGIVAELQN